MDKGRHILDEEDKEILNNIKEKMTEAIDKLKERNVRKANIQIEMELHIKNSLKE